MLLRFNILYGLKIQIIIEIITGHLINHMKKCHAVKKEPTRIHKCSMCSCVYNSINALHKHLNVFHGVKTKNVHAHVQNQVTKCVETVDETIHLIKGKKMCLVRKGAFKCFWYVLFLDH